MVTYSIRNTGVNNTFLWKTPSMFFDAGSELAVPEFQEAVFCREGRCLDIILSGDYLMREELFPLLREDLIPENIMIRNGAQIPCEIFFVNKGYSSNLIWGSGVPISIKFEKEHVESLLAVNGEISLRVADSKTFVETIFRKYGQINQFNQEVFDRDIRGILLDKIREHMPAVIAQLDISSREAVDCVNFINPQLRRILSAQVKRYGLEIVGFSINSFALMRKSVPNSNNKEPMRNNNDMFYVPGDGGKSYGQADFFDNQRQNMPEQQFMNPQMQNRQWGNPQMQNPQWGNPQIQNQQWMNQTMPEQQWGNQSSYVDDDDDVVTMLIQPQMEKSEM